MNLTKEADRILSTYTKQYQMCKRCCKNCKMATARTATEIAIALQETCRYASTYLKVKKFASVYEDTHWYVLLKYMEAVKNDPTFKAFTKQKDQLTFLSLKLNRSNKDILSDMDVLQYAGCIEKDDDTKTFKITGVGTELLKEMLPRVR